MIPIIVLIIMFIVIAGLGYQLQVMAFKIGYYEQTLINHRSDFSPERFAKIEEIMNKKSLLDTWEMLTFKE